MRLPKLTFILPYAAVLAVGASFYVAVRLAVAVRDDLRVTVLVGAAIAGLVAVFVLASYAASLHLPLRRAIRLAFTPTLLFIAGYGMFLLVERDATRVVVAATVMGLIGAFLRTVEGSGGETPRYGSPDLAHLALALHAVAAFCGLAFLLDLPAFSGVHPVGAAALAALLVGAIAHETLWHEGVPADRARPVALAFAALGAEFHIALSLLPALPIVGAAFAVTLLVPALTTSALVLKGAKAPRGPLALAAALAVIVLVSARWN